MAEKVKRLKPRAETLRRLFLVSGNQCAFPGCRQVMMDDDGFFVGQVCHIEAAEEGGPRFNKNQSNEDRRGFENLMLMCYEHHVKTDDISYFTVEKLQEIKGDHEAKFGDVAKKMLDSVTDHTEATTCRLPSTFGRLYTGDEALWGEELKETKEEFEDFAESVRMLPFPTRQLLRVIVTRAGVRGVSVGEISAACQLGNEELRSHLGVLERYGLIQEEDADAFNGSEAIELSRLPSGWEVLDDLKDFCSRSPVTLTELLVYLRFDLLD